MAMIDVSFSFSASDASFLEASEVLSPPVAVRQLAKREPDDYEAPGAPMRLPIRMPSLEDGEIREGMEEEVVEPMRSMATPTDLKRAQAEAAAARFWNMETVIQHWWVWDPAQKRFVFEKTIEKPVED